jgi:lysophospholipase L1-like esterase
MATGACGGDADSTGRGEAERPSVDAPAGPLDYVSLGDSLPTTEGGASRAYPAYYAGIVERTLGREVRLANEAVPGATSADLLRSLRSSSALRSKLAAAEIITVTISANDWEPTYNAFLAGGCEDLRCLDNRLDRIEENLEAIVGELLAIRSPEDTIIRFTDYFDSLIKNPVARAAGLRAHLWRDLVPTIRKWSEAICGLAESNGIACARMAPAFNGQDGSTSPYREGLLAIDGRHLSDEGHRLMARELGALGFAPLT